MDFTMDWIERGWEVVLAARTLLGEALDRAGLGEGTPWVAASALIVGAVVLHARKGAVR